MEELKRSILRDPLNRLIFSSQTGIFLVGGYIRDLLATGRRSRDLDPEAAQQLLDPAIHIMMEAVHRFEGTVNQVLGWQRD
jgi:hypothetical protein